MTVRLLQKLPLRNAAAQYLSEHPEGSPLYPAGSLASAAAVEKRVRVLSAWAGNREHLRDWLEGQNNFSPLHPAQQKNLDAVAQPGSLFILTGQQPGLLGGPALWFYKALTAANWARTWSRKLNRPVIPVFWVAGDDSDLAECNAVEWLEPDVPARSLSLEFPEPAASIPMSLRKLSGEGATQLVQGAREVWGDTAAKQVEECYREGLSISQAFMRLAQTFLGEEGILFAEGFAATRLAQPFLRRLVREAPLFHEAVGVGSRRFSQVLSLPPQVPLRPGTVPVFSLEQDQRTRLFFPDAGGRVYLQGAEGHDLLPELEQHHLLHSALTRPLMIEEIFPVLGHVLGPAELRYFAQLSDAFTAFGKSFPLLAPRNQATACSEKDWERLAALGLKPEDLPDFGPSRLRAVLVEKAWEQHPAAAQFPKAAYGEFTGSLRKYQEKLLPGGDMEMALRRMDRSFARYREAARQAVFTRESSETYASFLSLMKWLGNGSQDRHLNLLSLRHILGEGDFKALIGLLHETETATLLVTYA